MPGNANLNAAAKAKKDEFYTRLEDIELELRHYRSHFENKVVFCNCDDPFESNFFKYFALNFNRLGLKKLIATSYHDSPIAGTQLSMIEGGENVIQPKRKSYKAEVTQVRDATGNGGIDMTDVAQLFYNGENKLTPLRGDGDFRSQECLDLLDEADIVCTNPPFSLFREFVSTLISHQKSFIIIGNLNAIHYKEVFPLIRDNELWLGASIHSGDRAFYAPDDYPLEAAGCGIDEATGRKFIRVKGVRWFTNLDIRHRHEELILVKRYSPDEYLSYANYDAIDVDSTSKIPSDYAGLMGVPDSFLDVYNPEQFQIIGIGSGTLAASIGVRKNYRGRTDICYLQDGVYKCPYSRIIIRNKHPEVPTP